MLAAYLKAKHPDRTSTIARYLVRGLVGVLFGSISLLLLLQEGLNPWAALGVPSFFFLLGEWAMAVRGQKQLVQDEQYYPTATENREEERVERIIARGKSRYLWVNFATYGGVGLITIATLNLQMSEWLPIYMWVIAPLFAGWCGAAVAAEKWKREMRRREGGGTISHASEELKVFISTRQSTCGECGENLGAHAWITLTRKQGAVCLACADLEQLVFLPAGDAALTRRALKHSTLAAVVLKWSRTRKRYERQGLLVEVHALEQAEEECLADHEVRVRRREREAVRREEEDWHYVEQFGDRVRELFPSCPPSRERLIAEHACRKYSGRVGRSASAKRLDEEAVRLAVRAHLRHTETEYDQLLVSGHSRGEARAEVEEAVCRALERWGTPHRSH